MRTPGLAPKRNKTQQIQELLSEKQQICALKQRKIGDEEPDYANGKNDGNRVRQAQLLMQELSHLGRDIRHPAREAPFIVIPGKYTNGATADNLGLLGRKDG